MLNLIYNVKLKSIIWGLVVGGLLHCLGANCLESLMPWNTFLGCQLHFDFVCSKTPAWSGKVTRWTSSMR